MEYKDIDPAFKDGSIFKASDEDLNDVLKTSARFAIDNFKDHYLLKVLIVNSIKDQRHIDKIQRKNDIYTWIIITLTAISIVSSVISIYYAVRLEHLEAEWSKQEVDILNELKNLQSNGRS